MNRKKILLAALAATTVFSMNAVAQDPVPPGDETADGVHYFSVNTGDETKFNYYNNAATGADAIGIGPVVIAAKANSLAIGSTASALEEQSIGIGTNVLSMGTKSIAIGKNAASSVVGGVALGADSVADRELGVMGYNPTIGGNNQWTDEEIAAQEEAYNNWVDAANAYETDPTAENELAEIEAANAYRNTINTWESTLGAVSVGNAEAGFTRQITGVAAGSELTDAVNVAQLQTLGRHVDDLAVHYVSVKDGGIPTANYDNDGAIEMGAIAIGISATAKEFNAMAIGAETAADNEAATAVGAHALVQGDYGAAFGAYAHSAAMDALALGANSTASVAGGIALGSETVAATPAGKYGYLRPADDESAAWKSYYGALSIGDVGRGRTRQITGVAAGTELTDAVNVAQLQVIQTELNKVANGTIQSFQVGDGIIDEFFTVDKDNARFDIMGIAGSGIVTSIDGQKVMLGLDGRGVIDTINAVNNAKVTNIQAFFKLKDGTGADAEIELNNESVPELLFVGEENMLDVDVDDMGAGARVTIKTNANLGKNLDISENESILGLNEAVNNLGPWKLRANNRDERLIGKDDVVNFVDGEMTEVTIDGDNVKVDLNADTKTKINKIDGIEASVADLDERVTTEVGRLDGRIDAVDERITTEVGRLDGEVTRLDGEVERLDGEVVRLDGEIVRVEEKFDGEVERLDDKIDANKVSVIAGDNIEVTANETETEYKVALANDINVTSVTADKVTAGTVQADAYRVGDVTYIDENGINANNKVISNVAAGVAPTDATNVAQLRQVADHVAYIGRDVNELRNESREGDAMGMALAALKPLQFDPYDRSQVLAGVGGYRGEYAVALGLAHYTNEDTMFHAGLAYAGDSHLAFNAGASWRVGSGSRNTLPARYMDGPISSVYVMQEEMEQVLRENEAQREQLRAQDEKISAQQSIIEEMQDRLAALENKN